MSLLLRIKTLALLPVVLPQGIYVKKKTPRLPEPKGNRVGISGQGKPLSLVILGDSAAAGVGVDDQDAALLGSLVQVLSDNFSVKYWLNAKTGRTTKRVIYSVENMLERSVDVIVTSIGVNDVTQFCLPEQWIALQRELYTKIQSKFNPKLIVVTAVPPMQLFPALPKPLGTLFGHYSSQMNAALAQFVAQQQNMVLVDFDMEHYQQNGLQMAVDGFHPSAEIYQMWANTISEHIFKKFGNE